MSVAVDQDMKQSQKMNVELVDKERRPIGDVAASDDFAQRDREPFEPLLVSSLC